jgi:hypothetical protein
MGKITENMVFSGDVQVNTLSIVTGTLTAADLSASAALARTQMAQDALQPYPVRLTDGRVWDAIQTNLPGTPATDDLAIDGDTFGTGSPHLTAGDLKAAGATTRYARYQMSLPAEYDDGETVTIRINAGVQTTVSDTTCTVDVECYESDGELGISADICATAATTINSLTFADVDFAITPTDLVAGDVLDVRIAIACNDGATVTAVEPSIGSIELLCDIRG